MTPIEKAERAVIRAAIRQADVNPLYAGKKLVDAVEKLKQARADKRRGK